ncbi:MAG: hypothetical protein LBR10_06730, partial [Prevotellaceae bacterium]|nr:hypothetical protein [Prevotellaceae bacterium]
HCSLHTERKRPQARHPNQLAMRNGNTLPRLPKESFSSPRLTLTLARLTLTLGRLALESARESLPYNEQLVMSNERF